MPKKCVNFVQISTTTTYQKFLKYTFTVQFLYKTAGTPIEVNNFIKFLKKYNLNTVKKTLKYCMALNFLELLNQTNTKSITKIMLALLLSIE